MLEVDGGRCASRRSRAGGGGCCGYERVGVRRCPGLGCAVVPRVRGAVQTEFFSSVASLKNCTRFASPKSGLRPRNTHRGRRPPEDEPKGQGARRARPPLVGCICGLADSTSSASALRCCRCCRVARRGTVCPAPLPLGTACPIPCSSPHCTPVRVSCAPLPAKARVGPACSALPPPPSPFPFPVPSDAAVVARWLTLPLSSYPPSRHRSRSITEATSACGACTCGGAPPGVPADDVAVGISSCLPPPP